MLIAGIVSPSGIGSCDLENVYLNLTHTRLLGHHGWIHSIRLGYTWLDLFQKQIDPAYSSYISRNTPLK